MKKYIYQSIVLSIAILFTACSSDDDNALDNEVPTITVNVPQQEQHFDLGEKIMLNIELEDNVALAAYRLNIHHNADGHTHGVVTMSEDWEYNENITLENSPQSFLVEDEINIPTGITQGNYHFGIIVLDSSGNQSEAYVDIVIGEHDHDHHEH